MRFQAAAARLAGAALLAPALAPAAELAPGGGSVFGTLLQVVVALGVVLAAIAGAAWLMRRALPAMGGGGTVRVVGGTMVGPRERVVVVEVGETWLVLGVTSTNVNALHAISRPPGATADAAQAGAFPSLLSRLKKPSA
jgi:flagellar protein FliO/FliZ